MNYRMAPQVHHNENKEKRNFYMLPQQLMDVIFNEIDGRSGNELKLMAVLIGTKGDGSFRASEEWIKQRTGITKENYHRTKKKLADKGFLILEKGKIIVNIKGIMERALSAERNSPDGSPKEEYGDHNDEPSDHNEGMSNRNDYLSSDHSDDYNIEIINNYKKDNIKDSESVPSNEGEFSVLFNTIGISYNTNTKDVLEGIIKEELDYNVMKELVEDNRQTWNRQVHKSSSYKFGTLKKIIEKDYKRIKYKILTSKQQTINTVPLEHYDIPARDPEVPRKPKEKRRTLEDIENSFFDNEVKKHKQAKINYKAVETLVEESRRKEAEEGIGEITDELLDELF